MKLKLQKINLYLIELFMYKQIKLITKNKLKLKYIVIYYELYIY